MNESNGFEVIKHDQTPKITKWSLTPLYKINQRGATMYFQVGFDPSLNKVITVVGQLVNLNGVRGKLKTNYLEVRLNKSGRNIYEQALLNTKSKYNDKIKNNYRPDGEMDNIHMEPQLAHTYILPYTIEISTGKVLTSQITEDHLERGISCQVKLDGIRGIFWIEKDNKTILMSRKNKEFTKFQHINEELFYFTYYVKNIISNNKNKFGEVEDIGIDGELYNHDLSLQEISSIVRTETHIHDKLYEIKYYIFDILVENISYEHRYWILNEAYKLYSKSEYNKNYLVVLNNETAHTYERINELHTFYVDLKYEGLMIRKMIGLGTEINPVSQVQLDETYYKSSRNNNLLKYKKFIDEEAIVVDIISGVDKEQGLAIPVIKDIRGNVFSIHPMGTYEVRKEWLLNKQNYIGLPYTFRYQELSKSNIPKITVGVAFRNYE